MCCCSGSAPILLGGFVFVSAVIWWINTRFNEVMKELKKK